jgi:hypothetical protein
LWWHAIFFTSFRTMYFFFNKMWWHDIFYILYQSVSIFLNYYLN